MAATGYRKLATKRWPKAYWIRGDGPYATLAHCRVLTIELHPSLEDAQKAKALIDKFGCGGVCYRAHEIVDVARSEARP